MWKGFLSICAAVAVTALTLSQAQAAKPLFKEGEVVVKLKTVKGIQRFDAQATTLVQGLSKHYAVAATPLLTDKSIYKLKVRGRVSMSQLISDIQANPAVEYAEPNFIYHTMTVPAKPASLPNDPSLNLNWGLLNTGQKDSKGQEGTAGSDIGATKAWDIGTGSLEIKVAVIDTGVDYNHPELKNNIMTNAKEIAGNGKDDDGNGFIDDVHGWNFEGKSADPMDDNRHGTHCSGTIGAEGNNGVGTAGVNWHVSILPIKFLSASGSGSLADAVEAINYATLMGVNIMSNSWGGGGFSQTMFDAIKKAKAKGILFVAAAGNEGNNNDASASYPASYDSDNVVAVAATDNRDVKASWSSYGQRKVHLAAPGVNVYSTVPVVKGGYDTFSGTSMACPHVAGAAALLWSLNTNMTYAEIKARLLATVDPVRALKTKTLTGGRLNIFNAVTNTVPERKDPPADRWKAIAYAVDSAHPYKSNTKQSFEVSHPGAKFIRLHFSKIGTEAGYDLVQLADGTGAVVEELSGNQTDYTTDYVEGDKATINFSSDSSVDGFGFAVDRYDFVD